MAANWKLTARAPRPIIEAALAAQGAIEDWNSDIVVGASEVADAPQDWLLEAWLPRRPTRMDTIRLEKLFAARAPEFAVERLPDVDWVIESQQASAPIIVGRFRVRTPDYPPLADSGLIELEIPAAQAFGTGQHATTSGCLEMLGHMKALGVHPRNIADIGTGTGLLALAALRLWPNAFMTATDNDPVCTQAVLENVARNGAAIGSGKAQLTFSIADGMESELVRLRGAYDLLIANILASPLVEMAPDFAANMAPRGHILLAGLLTSQEQALRSAYRQAGFRLVRRLVRGEWSVLWLRRRFAGRSW